MQRLTGCSAAKHRNHHAARDHEQPRRHQQADGANQADCRNCGNDRRQHVPCEHVLDRENRIRCRGDAAGEHAGQAIGEIARRVPGQMTKHVAAKIASDADEREARDPARDSPQEIVGGNERYEKNECQPYMRCVSGSRRQRVDQELHAVLRAHRAGNRGNNGNQYDQMCSQPLAQIAQHEQKRAMRIS